MQFLLEYCELIHKCNAVAYMIYWKKVSILFIQALYICDGLLHFDSQLSTWRQAWKLSWVYFNNGALLKTSKNQHNNALYFHYGNKSFNHCVYHIRKRTLYVYCFASYVWCCDRAVISKLCLFCSSVRVIIMVKQCYVLPWMLLM